MNCDFDVDIVIIAECQSQGLWFDEHWPAETNEKKPWIIHGSLARRRDKNANLLRYIFQRLLSWLLYFMKTLNHVLIKWKFFFQEYS